MKLNEAINLSTEVGILMDMYISILTQNLDTCIIKLFQQDSDEEREREREREKEKYSAFHFMDQKV